MWSSQCGAGTLILDLGDSVEVTEMPAATNAVTEAPNISDIGMCKKLRISADRLTLTTR